MEAYKSPSPLSRTSVPGHIQAGLSTGRGLLLFPAEFTAGGCDATASSAALRREGAGQGQRGVPPTPKLVFLPISLSQDDPGVRGAYGRSGGRWAPRSAAGSGRRRPAGPRPGGCRHLEIGGGHGVELGTVCPGDGVWGVQGAKQLRTSGGDALSQRYQGELSRGNLFCGILAGFPPPGGRLHTQRAPELTGNPSWP